MREGNMHEISIEKSLDNSMYSNFEKEKIKTTIYIHLLPSLSGRVCLFLAMANVSTHTLDIPPSTALGITCLHFSLCLLLYLLSQLLLPLLKSLR